MEEDADNSQVPEVKEDKKGAEIFKTAIKIVVGIILITIGIWAVIGWWKPLWTVFKGGIGILLILAGVVTIVIARD